MNEEDMNLDFYLNIGSALSSILTLITTIVYLRRGAIISLQWNNKRKLKSLENQLLHIKNLKNDPNYFIRWVSESILTVLAILSVALVLKGISLDPHGEKLSSFGISMMAFVAYTISIHKIGQFKQIKNFEKTVETMESKISRIKTKLENNLT